MRVRAASPEPPSGRTRLLVLTAVLAGAALLAGRGCAPAEEGWRNMPGPVTKGKPADNSHCLVCHMDFKAEALSVAHVRKGIGCEGCHGPSWPHGDDEFNIMPPDVLYGRAEVDRFCKPCHAEHKEGEVYRGFVRTWRGRRRLNGRIVSEESVCTDCHGNHAVVPPDKQVATPPAGPRKE